MKANVEITLVPFRVPNYVLSVNEVDNDEAAKFHLKELSPEVLDELCQKFRDEVFKKAEKTKPVVAVASDRCVDCPN